MMDDGVDAALHVREEDGRARLHSHVGAGLQVHVQVHARVQVYSSASAPAWEYTILGV